MAEFNKRDFGERLRNFRKNKGLSQENLAKVIGKNATTIARIRYPAREYGRNTRIQSIFCPHEYLPDAAAEYG